MLENWPHAHPVQRVSPPARTDDLHARLLALVSDGMADSAESVGFTHPLAFRLTRIERLLLDARQAEAPDLVLLEQKAIASLLLRALWEEEAGRPALARYLRAHAHWWQQALQPDWTIQSAAVELLPPGAVSPRQRASTLILEHLDSTLQPTPEALAWLERIPVPSVGPDHDPKLRVHSIRIDLEQPSSVRLCLGPSSWTQGRGFHRMLEQPGLPLSLRRAQLGWLSELLTGRSSLPDILAVHVACVTTDGALVLLRRSRQVSYAPGCWSLSFEEQLSWQDLPGSDGQAGEGDVLASAVSRGAHEELGVTLASSNDVYFLGFYLDLKVLSIGLMALARLPVTAEGLKRHWATRAAYEGPSTSLVDDAWESDALQCLPLSAVQGKTAPEVATLMHAATGGGPFHPTAWLRLQRLLRSDLL